MIDKKSFEVMRKEMEAFDKGRESLIKISRDVLKFSKGAIYSLHRSEIETADNQLKEARKIISEMNSMIKKDAHLASVGSYNEALEEYVEASCYFEFLKSKKIPSPKDLGVDTDTYLPGLCDLVGELVRKAMNSAIKGDLKLAAEIKDFVSEIYEELMLFDFRNIPVRRKFDAIKYGLEKLEDLMVKIKFKEK